MRKEGRDCNAKAWCMDAYTGSRTQNLHLQMGTALRMFPADSAAAYIHTVAVGKLEL